MRHERQDSRDQPLIRASPEQRVRAILRTGENLLWWGVPTRRRFLSEMIAYVIFGLIPCAMSSLFLFLIGQSIVRDGFQWSLLLVTLIALGFFTLGIGCLLFPWKMSSRLREVVYAVTDQRAIVLTSPKLFWNPVPANQSRTTQMDFTPEQIRQYQRKWRDFGRVDLIFAKEWRKGRRGGEWFYYGFLGLNNPSEAEHVIQVNYPTTK